jgi:hypothetical protein
MGGYTEQGGGVQPGSVWMPLPGSLLGARYFVTLFLPSRVGVLALAAKTTFGGPKGWKGQERQDGCL